jgi:hypothetical protein
LRRWAVAPKWMLPEEPPQNQDSCVHRRPVAVPDAAHRTDPIESFRLSLPRHASEVGRFLRKRHVHGAGPLGDRSLPGGSRAISRIAPWTGPSQAHFRGRAISPKTPMSAVPHRSEIGPYPEVLGRYPGLRLGLGLLRHTSGVGRFLRKRHVLGAGPLGDRSLPGGSRAISRIAPWTGPPQAHFRGRAISPKAPCPRCRTARRSVPTRRFSGDIQACAMGWAFPGTLPR